MNKPKVLISILNWNKAEQTLACVASLMADINPAIADVTVLVIDNGSKAEEVVLLHEASAKSGFALHAVPKNLGFTGGHNVAIQMAIDEQYDFIWLMNNDATVNAGVLSKLIKAMHSNPRCGAVSPVRHLVSIRCTDLSRFCSRWPAIIYQGDNLIFFLVPTCPFCETSKGGSCSAAPKASSQLRI